MAKEKKPVWYENKIKRTAEYKKQNIKQYKIEVNRNTEAELIEHLEQQENKQSYIKHLIIEDMTKKKI